MSLIKVCDLSFTYPGSYTPVFTGINFSVDTDWRLGLVGRNGRGKTTLLKLLSGELQGTGSILSYTGFDYFPYEADESKSALDSMRSVIAPFVEWANEMEVLLAEGDPGSLVRWGELEQLYSANGGYEIDELLEREAGKLGFQKDDLARPLSTFSPGERTRLKIAALFLRKNRFLLIDEPTNHLDLEGRKTVANYLKTKKGFILVSHDRRFLDETADHILALHKSGIWIENCNYSGYREKKLIRDAAEAEENERLSSEIERLKTSVREKAAWSDKVERSKKGGPPCDKGFIGHQSAKMMKRALAIQKRTEQKALDKQALLHDIEYASKLSLHPLIHPAKVLMRLRDAAAGYAGGAVFEHATFDINQGDRIAVIGRNGSGKSTLLKLLLEKVPILSGQFTKAGGLIISELPQTAEDIKGTPFDLAARQGLDPAYFLMLLRKLDFRREAFERDISGFSMGQVKKVLLAASMALPAHLYIWDEPLNYIDLESREQIEEMLLLSGAAMVFVEHDEMFVERVATKIIRL
jgi:lincosamide and streptogramin A transport system ATP-binding/permease protein